MEARARRRSQHEVETDLGAILHKVGESGVGLALNLVLLGGQYSGGPGDVMDEGAQQEGDGHGRG